MNITDAKIFAGELSNDLSTLDLHGFFPSEALEKLELFLYEQNQNNIQIVKVIYGAGTGKLKTKVLEYLKEHPLVDAIKDEGGAAIVILS